MNQKELAEKTKTMQRDYSNAEIAQMLGVRLEDLNAALMYKDSAIRVYTITETVKVEPEKVEEPKKRGRKKKGK